MPRKQTKPFALFDSQIEQIIKRNNADLDTVSKIMTHIGLSTSAPSAWRRNGQVPELVLWGLAGLVASMPNPESTKNKAEPIEFSLNEIKVILSHIPDTYGTILRKLAKLLIAKT